MKKLFILICFVLVVAGCSNPNIIVGDDMVVTSVRRNPNDVYKTVYRVQVRSLNDCAGYGTFKGQYLEYYTNTLYTVGDTLTIANKHNE